MRSKLAPHLITAIEHAHCASCYLQNPVIRQSISSFWPTPPSAVFLVFASVCLLASVFKTSVGHSTALRFQYAAFQPPMIPLADSCLALSAPCRCHLRIAFVPPLAFILDPRQCCKSILEVPFHKLIFKSSSKFVVSTVCSSF